MMIIDFIELLKVIFLGIIEGLTEWLPISSTGHMILVDTFLHLNVSSEFKEMFFVVIQLGAIFAVIITFFKILNPFSAKKNTDEKKDTWKIIFKTLLACIPAGVIGLLFDDKIDALFYNYQTVATTLIIYGLLFIVVEVWNKKKSNRKLIQDVKDISFTTAFLIGIAQVLSLIPGTSRSGSTILAGILLGSSRVASSEFSFFLSIPVMLGASFIKLLKFGFSFTMAEIIILLIGMIVAFIVSVFSIKFLMNYIKDHDFKIFGYYRILLGAIIIICGLIGIIK